MTHHGGTKRRLSVELALDVRLCICGRGWWWAGGWSRSRRGLTAGQRLAKVVHAEPLLAGLPHEAQREQAALHNPRGGVRRPARPVRPGPVTFTSSVLRERSNPLKGQESRGDAPDRQIGHHQNRPGGLDAHHRDTQCPNELELPRRVDLWCILDHCERRGGHAKEPSPELDCFWRVSVRRGGGD